MTPGDGRVADLHKSAFWIYGVTAMVMREPLANAVRRLASPGIGSPEVQGELLRTAAVLALMARQFLASGLYFDRVHLRPDAGSHYPRRSYPVDFLGGLAQFLIAVAASTAIQSPAYFAALAAAFLLFEIPWAATSAALRLSTAAEVARMGRPGAVTFLLCGATWMGMELSDGNAARSLVPPLLLLALTTAAIARLITAYGRPVASGAASG